MQSPPFSILRINNNNPHHTSNPSKQDKEDKQDNACLSQSLTLPIGLADAEEREEKENKENNPPPAPRKEESHSQEMECTLLITPMRLTRLFQSEVPLVMQMMMFSQIIHELCKMRQKVMQRKRRLQQLCC